MIAIIKFAEGVDFKQCNEIAHLVSSGLDGGIVPVLASEYRLTILNDKYEVVYESNE